MYRGNLLIINCHFNNFLDLFITLSFFFAGSAVNILLVTPEKAIKLTANDAFRYLLLDKHGYI